MDYKIPPETCRSINKLQERLKELADSAKTAKKELSDIHERLESIEDEAGSISLDLEEIRSANSALREAAEGYKDEYETILNED